MIEIDEMIDIPAPPDQVWALLSDPHAVVDCVPGATLGEEHDDGSFDAGIVVKFGPAKVTFRARVMLELDPATMTGKVSSKGKDNQGGTRFSATMAYGVTGGTAPPQSIINIKANTEITGRLSSLVESGASLVIKYMTNEFSKRLAAKFSPSQANA